MNALWDFREADSPVGLIAGVVSQFARFVSQNRQLREEARVAVLPSSQAAAVGNARLADLLKEAQPKSLEIRVFDKLDAAEGWLTEPADSGGDEAGPAIAEAKVTETPND